MSDALLKEICERREYAVAAWQEIRKEGATDMKYVSGDPWDENDKKARKDRPTVAPEEMGQYFNAVINALRANPRGVKFSPTGNGATDKTARFYQNKARETENRSHALTHYVTAAENAIQRSYGFVRVDTRYASTRSPNQEIWVDGFPDPDMVLPDPDAKSPDSSDMGWCFVDLWRDENEFTRKHKGLRNGRGLRFPKFGGFSGSHPDWIKGKKVLEAEYWEITTTPKKLFLVEMAPPKTGLLSRLGVGAPAAPAAPAKQFVLFEDEIADRPRGSLIVKRELRTVDVPKVKMYLTNGLELLHEQDWAGKFIPIVSCYGKILYVPEGGQTKRKLMSMTRFGRDPWKSYCYACSQELEVLGMVPKAPLMIAKGQMDPEQLAAVQKSLHVPTAALTYNAKTVATGENILPPPGPVEYPVGQHLQALEVVKEGFRRSIQAAMGSNFLPTSAQNRNQKSGKALDKIEQMATQGTFHFVDSYDGMIRRTGEIFEDLLDKIHDYSGETGVMEADGKASMITINTPSDPDAIDTKGDHLVTVSTGPSSDSERDAADDFTDTLVNNLKTVIEVSGPKVGAAVLAQSIRMRNLGPRGDQLADLIEPAEFKSKDGEPPSPEMIAAQGQIQHLMQQLQQAAQEKAEKTAEMQGKLAIEQFKANAELKRLEVEHQQALQLAQAERETELAVAALTAKNDREALFLEERGRLGLQLDDQRHEAAEADVQRRHEVVLQQQKIDADAAQRTHDRAAAQATKRTKTVSTSRNEQGQLQANVVEETVG